MSAESSAPGGTMKPAVSRGDEPLKIDNWPQAIVAIAGMVATGGLVAFLVSAGWSGEAIGAFATLALGIVASQYVNARKASQVEAKTDAQTETLDTIVAQTNGMTEEQLETIAALAADKAAVAVIQAWKRGDV